MKTRLVVASFIGLFALPLLCVAQNEEEAAPADPEDAIIRLNPNAEGLDVWSQMRDTSNDAEREPGLVPVGRLRRPGVLSFFGLPLAFTPEDLTAANVDVAIVGAPLDMGFRMRGARQGPTALRASIGVGSGSLPHMHVGVAWKKELVAVDYGNAPLDGLSVERSMPPVRKLVREIAETGTIPIVIGGDHSLEYPDVAAIADVYGKENVGVVHFDAHFGRGQLWRSPDFSWPADSAVDRRRPCARQELHPGRAARILAGRRWLQLDA